MFVLLWIVSYIGVTGNPVLTYAISGKVVGGVGEFGGYADAVTAKGTGPQDRTGPRGRSRCGRDSTHRRPCGTSPQSGDPV